MYLRFIKKRNRKANIGTIVEYNVIEMVGMDWLASASCSRSYIEQSVKLTDFGEIDFNLTGKVKPVIENRSTSPQQHEQFFYSTLYILFVRSLQSILFSWNGQTYIHFNKLNISVTGNSRFSDYLVIKLLFKNVNEIWVVLDFRQKNKQTTIVRINFKHATTKKKLVDYLPFRLPNGPRNATPLPITFSSIYFKILPVSSTFLLIRFERGGDLNGKSSLNDKLFVRLAFFRLIFQCVTPKSLYYVPPRFWY